MKKLNEVRERKLTLYSPACVNVGLGMPYFRVRESQQGYSIGGGIIKPAAGFTVAFVRTRLNNIPHTYQPKANARKLSTLTPLPDYHHSCSGPRCEGDWKSSSSASHSFIPPRTSAQGALQHNEAGSLGLSQLFLPDRDRDTETTMILKRYPPQKESQQAVMLL